MVRFLVVLLISCWRSYSPWDGFLWSSYKVRSINIRSQAQPTAKLPSYSGKEYPDWYLT